MLAAAELPTPPRNTDMLISVAVVLPRDECEAADFEARLEALETSLRRDFEYFEILLVDNACWPLMADRADAWLRRFPNLRRLRLSRYYSTEIAITAALDHSIGDYVVIMDLRTDSPDLIAKFAALGATGYDAVIALPVARKESLLERLVVRRTYALVSRILRFELYPEDSYFRVFSRRLVNSIVKIRSKSRYLGSLNSVAGFQHCKVSYEPLTASSAGGVHRLVRQLAAASNILVSNSATPLRFAAALGVLASIGNFFYLFYILAVTLVKRRIAEGWLTTSLTQTVMFLILFLIVAIVAEYIVRVLDESKEQPLYFVESEANSTVATPRPERLNVVQ